MAMPQTVEVRLNLPIEVVERIDDAAQDSNRPRESVIADAVMAAVPASRRRAEQAVDARVRSMEKLTREELEEMRDAWFPKLKDQRLSKLLETQQYRHLNTAEKAELKELLVEAEDHAARRAAARLVLRSRFRRERNPQ